MFATDGVIRQEKVEIYIINQAIDDARKAGNHQLWGDLKKAKDKVERLKEVYKEKYGPDGGLDMGSEGPNISVELSPDRKSYKGLVITDF